MGLSTTQLARMSRLLDEALPLDEAGRRAWLEHLLPQHHDLVGFLRKALLPGETQDSSYAPLGTRPKFNPADDESLASASGLQPGAHIGPYQLVRPLGTGGMAEVWLARRADGAFKREVALKLPMLTRLRKDLEQRFFRECDILAGLEHPHIARLYDAGIDADGLPYLSMEYVHGQQITTWCDTQLLAIPERLRLFLQILDAVQYAHEKHVIHRDLKPSNVLVAESQQVQLLDFGVAKMLQAEQMGQTQITSVYGHAMTPVYASPELLRGDATDARSDIYSLGVLLYEILSGSRPYRLKGDASLGAQAQAIVLNEVQRPSTQLAREAGALRATTQEQLSRQLRGDLDAIVLKALAKEPAQRYSSAQAMSEDLQRHLQGAPIHAQPHRSLYRLRKFLWRYRTDVAMAAAAIAVILAALGYTLHRERLTQARIETRAVAMLANMTKPISDKSIAVLPFVDLSEKQDQGYFSDGLTEELIGRLTQIQDLQVIARTSSFYFRGKQIASAQIGKTLGVSHLLEGSVRRAGQTLRVTAQLIRADSGMHLWSQTYDRDIKDIFQVQDEISTAVVASLKLKLLPSQQVADPERSDKPEAYNQFLLGRQYARHGNLEDFRRSLAAYRQATRLDPGYAAAYAGISFTETAIANATLDTAGFERARESSEKALALAPQLIEGLRTRATYRRETLDFAGARADSARALALAPGDSMVQSSYGVSLAFFGRIAEAILSMRRAIELDPLNSYAWANLGLFLTAGRDYPAARLALERAVALNSESDALHIALAQLNMLEGRLPTAAVEFEKQGNVVGSLMGEAMIEHARGREPQSRKALQELIAKHAQDSTYQIGEVYAWRGENDKAFEWLERAFQQRDSGLNGIHYDPLLAGLREDPRYQALLKELKLSE